ncbi:MAG TPA: glycosyltransferase, partial [Gammaproteobacteria bacterium]
MIEMVKQPVMIMAGGTGGHVYPGLAVADELRTRGVPVIWLGTHKGIEARLVPEAGIEVDWLGVSGLRGKGVVSLILAPINLAAACFQAMRILL